jgi:UDP-N-acetylmuramoyl-L-alanyl-D-glutamate--2,6-diaminopimelate ligase
MSEVIPQGVRLVTYGLSSRGVAELPLTLSGSDVELGFDGTRAMLEAPEFGIEHATLHVPAIGAIYVENALAALGAALALGIASDLALRVLSTAPTPEGRFEVVHRHPDVVVDYAHTPDALIRTLMTARALCAGRIWLVFGAGGHRDRGKRPLLGRAAEAADEIILTSDNPRDEAPEAIADEIRAGMVDPARTRWVCDRRAAIALALAECAAEDLVLVAGKGHEREQTDRDGTRPFSDRVVIESILGRA